MRVKLKKQAVICLFSLCILSYASAQTDTICQAEYSAAIRIACVGDSITFGSQIEDGNNNYPAQLGKLLGDKFEVMNFGYPGARVSLCSQKCYMNFPEYNNSLKYQPDVVVIALGINDCSVNEWQKNKEVFVKSYKKLIHSYQELNSKPKIWLANLMPVMPPYEPYLDIHKNIKECQLLIESVAKQTGLTVIDLFSELNRQHRIYAQDGIHPSREGAAIIAKKVYSAITGDFGGLSLPYVFGNHMVIQRDKPVRVFGTGNVGDTIDIKLSKYKHRTSVDGNGKWFAEMPALKAGGPYTLTVSTADKTIEYNDVMVGEVWFCAGQSNMAFQMKSDLEADTFLPLADNNPEIRLLKREIAPGLGKKVFTKAESEIIQLDGYYSGNWQVCSSESAAEFSAVGYYFAMELYKSLGVPIGIIENAVGGAPIETFMPREAFEDENLYKCQNDWLNSETPFWHIGRAKLNLGNGHQTDKRLLAHHPYEPTFIYYADIEEVMPYTIKGVIWYQGESNATEEDAAKAWNPEINKIMFKNLVTSWRTNWKSGDFPFYYVQLPNMNRSWMPFRQMQFEVLNELPNVGMAVTIDVGDANNVHPKFKYEVGRRLSLWAKAKTYRQKNVVYSGPLFKKVSLSNNRIYVEFDCVGSGLIFSNGEKLIGFEIEDAGGNWNAVDSYIDRDRVVINIDVEDRVSAVRYAWQPNPKANLTNEEKLPASPFCVKLFSQE